MGVCNHAYHFMPHWLACYTGDERPAQRVLVGPHATGQGFIYNNQAGSGFNLLLCKRTSAKNWRAHCGEVVSGDLLVIGDLVVLVGLRLALYVEALCLDILDRQSTRKSS